MKSSLLFFTLFFTGSVFASYSPGEICFGDYTYSANYSMEITCDHSRLQDALKGNTSFLSTFACSKGLLYYYYCVKN